MPASAPARPALTDLAYVIPQKISPNATMPAGLSPPSVQERAHFFRSFSVLFRAGVSLERSLDILSRQSENQAFRMLLQSMAKDLVHGHSLTAVFSRVPEVFTAYHVRMIRVGEMSGRMDDSLEQLALAEERTGVLNLKVKSALMYPAWTMVIAVTFLLFIPPYLMDGLFDAIQVTGGELPALTVFVEGIFRVVRHPVFQVAFASGVGALVYYYPRIVQSESFKQWLLTTAVKFPLTRKFAKAFITARFARSFSTMLEAGVPPALSLRLAGEEVGTRDYKDAGVEALYRLENGEEFATAVTRIPHLRGFFHEFLRAGEETGMMADMTSRAADLAEEEVENQLELMVALIEPFVMVFIGGVVGVLVLASMLPMISVLDSF
jgi:type IV pilus assembly protein PilC